MGVLVSPCPVLSCVILGNFLHLSMGLGVEARSVVLIWGQEDRSMS